MQVSRQTDLFAILIERYKAPITRFVRRLSYGYPQDVDDIVQETFIRAYRFINNFDPQLKFSSWLYRIARNESLRFLKKISKQPIPISYFNEESNLEYLLTDLDEFQTQKHSFSKEDIHQAISKLPEKYKSILVLKYLEERTYNEISDILRIPSGTVSTNLHRAKKQLAKLLL